VGQADRKIGGLDGNVEVHLVGAAHDDALALKRSLPRGVRSGRLKKNASSLSSLCLGTWYRQDIARQTWQPVA
jgi:hypothetical protein